MKRATVVTLLVAIALVFLGAGATLAASETFIIVQITVNTVTDHPPKVSGDRVVWTAAEGVDGGI